MTDQELAALKATCLDFFYWWYNHPGSNTEQGFDQWAETRDLSAVTKAAHERGMRDAAEIARDCQDECIVCTDKGACRADAILSAIPNHKQGGDEATAHDQSKEMADALSEMIALWERVHGMAIIGRPTVNAAKKAYAVYLANHKQGGKTAEAKVDVCCGWERKTGKNMPEPEGFYWVGCREGKTAFRITPPKNGNECPYCGKPIKIAEAAKGE